MTARPARPATPATGECTAPKHDTPSAYDWWGCRCPKAREAHRLARRRRRHGTYRSKLASPVGTVRRARALVAIGHPARDLAARLGLSPRRVGEVLHDRSAGLQTRTVAAFKALYDELSMTPGPSDRCRAYAARRGWLGPLWFDEDRIDDETYDPLAEATDTGEDVDEVAVDRALKGEPVRLNRLERHVAVHEGRRRGHPLSNIALALHINYAEAKRWAAKPLPDSVAA